MKLKKYSCGTGHARKLNTYVVLQLKTNSIENNINSMS